MQLSFIDLVFPSFWMTDLAQQSICWTNVYISQLIYITPSKNRICTSSSPPWLILCIWTSSSSLSCIYASSSPLGTAGPPRPCCSGHHHQSQLGWGRGAPHHRHIRVMCMRMCISPLGHRLAILHRHTITAQPSVSLFGCSCCTLVQYALCVQCMWHFFIDFLSESASICLYSTCIRHLGSNFFVRNTKYPAVHCMGVYSVSYPTHDIIKISKFGRSISQFKLGRSASMSD